MSTLEKIGIRTKLAIALHKMRHYLMRNGHNIDGLNKRKIAILYAKVKYSEDVVDTESWLIKKIDAGEFSGMNIKKPKEAIKTKPESNEKANYKKEYEEFLKTPYWRKIRIDILERDGYKCTQCCSVKNLHIHHTTYVNHFYEHEHLEDLITLCKQCHNNIHDKKPKKKKTKSKAYKKAFSNKLKR